MAATYFSNFTQDNPFFNTLESGDDGLYGLRANYNTFSPNFGTGSRRRFFEDSFRRVLDQAEGRVATGLKGFTGGPGELEPALGFNDFLNDYFTPGGGADRDFYSLSPAERGQGTARFAPPVRFLR